MDEISSSPLYSGLAVEGVLVEAVEFEAGFVVMSSGPQASMRSTITMPISNMDRLLVRMSPLLPIGQDISLYTWLIKELLGDYSRQLFPGRLCEGNRY